MEFNKEQIQYTSVIKTIISLCTTDSEYPNIDIADIKAMFNPASEIVVGIGQFCEDEDIQAAVERATKFPVQYGQSFDSVKNLLVCISGPQMKKSSKEHSQQMIDIISERFKELEKFKLCFVDNSNTETCTTITLFGTY